MTTKFATVYADTDEGQRLPIVDVTNPAFALDVTDSELHAQTDRFVAESSSRTEIPAAVRGFRHLQYDWSAADRLPPLLREWMPSAAACAISSERALFEYGSDAVVAANLTQRHHCAPASAVVVGSVTRDGAPTRAAQAASRVPTHPRTLDAFAQLAGRVGWTIDATIERRFTYNVRLIKAA